MDKQKPAKKSATTSSRNKTQRKAKARPTGVMSNVSSKKSNTPNRKAAPPKSAPCPASPKETEKKEGPPTDREKKEKKEKVAPVKKKKAEPVIPEKKLDRTQEDEKETESGLSLVVKEASVPVKMDDGYEDFGPGANNP